MNQIIEPRLLNLIDSIFKLIFGFSLFFLVIVLIYLGILYITGDQKGLEKVHSRWHLILIGIVLAFLSLTIPKIIRLFFE